jgi:hypothetical protein
MGHGGLTRQGSGCVAHVKTVLRKGFGKPSGRLRKIPVDFSALIE